MGRKRSPVLVESETGSAYFPQADRVERRAANGGPTEAPSVIWTIQYTDTAKNETEARESLSFLATQIDYRGGRVLPAIGDIPWRVQAFFEDAGETAWLPDGCLRALTPERMLS